MLLFCTGKRQEKAVGEEAAQSNMETREEFTEAQKKEAAIKVTCGKRNCGCKKN